MNNIRITIYKTLFNFRSIRQSITKLNLESKIIYKSINDILASFPLFNVSGYKRLLYA